MEFFLALLKILDYLFLILNGLTSCLKLILASVSFDDRN